MATLREQMVQDMQIKGLSRSTQTNYVRAVSGIALHYDISPDRLDRDQVRSYLHYLIEERKLSQSYINQVYSGPSPVAETDVLSITDARRLMQVMEERFRRGQDNA